MHSTYLYRMYYEIPYEPEKAKRQFDLIWKETSKEIFSQMKQYGVLSAILTIGAIITAFDNAFGVMMLIFAIMLGFNFLLFLFRYRQAQKKFYAETKQIVAMYTQQPAFSVAIGLDDDSFTYRDSLIDIKIKWEAFRHYTIVNEILFFGMTSELYRNYSVSSSEIGTLEFEKVVEFVKQKITLTE